MLQEDQFFVVNQEKLKHQYDDQVIQLKNNKLPKGIVTLESIFNADDQLKKNKVSIQVKEYHYEEVEIFKGKLLKLGKICSAEDKRAFIVLFQEYHDVFAWKYFDLRGFDPHIAQHTIELEPGVKPIRHKKRPLNPKLEPLMTKELTKLVEGGIIFPIKHTSWVSNLVPVRKKSSEIRLCVDFRDLNRASLKDHYPLLSMEQILQAVAGS